MTGYTDDAKKHLDGLAELARTCSGEFMLEDYSMSIRLLELFVPIPPFFSFLIFSNELGLRELTRYIQ